MTSTLQRISAYYYLTKPGIIRGNLLTLVAGFLYGSSGNINWTIIIFSMIGTTLTIAAGSVFNNVMDIGLDKKMKRTAKRATASGAISITNAIIFGSILSFSGLLVLNIYVSQLVFIIGAAGLLAYVLLYGYFKRKSIYGTAVGTISGGAAIVAGYAAATDSLDLAALLLFAIMAVWQMAHFYAIAIFRSSEYKAAGLPVISVIKGADYTKKQIIAFITLFPFIAALPLLFGLSSASYALIMATTGGYWLYSATSKSSTKLSTEAWSKRQFGLSLVVLLVFCVALSLDPYLI